VADEEPGDHDLPACEERHQDPPLRIIGRFVGRRRGHRVVAEVQALDVGGVDHRVTSLGRADGSQPGRY
jgi:hypothetical protein